MIKSYPRFCLEEHKLKATRCCISSNTWLVLLYLIAYSQKHCCNTGLFILIMSIHKRYKHQLLLYTKCSIIGICKVLHLISFLSILLSLFRAEAQAPQGKAPHQISTQMIQQVEANHLPFHQKHTSNARNDLHRLDEMTDY